MPPQIPASRARPFEPQSTYVLRAGFSVLSQLSTPGERHAESGIISREHQSGAHGVKRDRTRQALTRPCLSISLALAFSLSLLVCPPLPLRRRHPHSRIHSHTHAGQVQGSTSAENTELRGIRETSRCGCPLEPIQGGVVARVALPLLCSLPPLNSVLVISPIPLTSVRVPP